MRPDEATIQETPTLDGEKMMTLMALGVAEALRKHRAAGVPAITWDEATQQVVEIPADQIPTWIDEPDAFPQP